MAEKIVTVDTDQAKGVTFKISESNGYFYIYRHRDNIGKTRTFEDALSLIKVSAGGAVKNIKIN